MKFYHGTSPNKLEEIKSEGVLWGIRSSEEFNPDRCTYLTPMLEEAKEYGDVVLEVDYDPTDNAWVNNYFPDEWQHREYKPIPLSMIVEIEQ